MKKYLNKRADTENLKLTESFYPVFFFKNWTNHTKKNVLKIILYFAYTPSIHEK